MISFMLAALFGFSYLIAQPLTWVCFVTGLFFSLLFSTHRKQIIYLILGGLTICDICIYFASKSDLHILSGWVLGVTLCGTLLASLLAFFRRIGKHKSSTEDT